MYARAEFLVSQIEAFERLPSFECDLAAGTITAAIEKK